MLVPALDSFNGSILNFFLKTSPEYLCTICCYPIRHFKRTYLVSLCKLLRVLYRCFYGSKKMSYCICLAAIQHLIKMF